MGIGRIESALSNFSTINTVVDSSIVNLSVCWEVSVLILIEIVNCLSVSSSQVSNVLITTNQQVFQCFTTQELHIFKCIQHRKKFTFNVVDVFLTIQVRIDNTLDIGVTTSNQVTSNSRDNVISEISDTLLSVGDSEFALLIERNVDKPFLFQHCHCLISNRLTVEVEKVSTITESVTSWSNNIQHIVNQISNKGCDLRRRW